MKMKLHAGAELDLLSPDEFRRELRSWSAEISRGARFLRRPWVATGNGAAGLQIKGEGPAEGFIWAVTRLSVSGPGFDPATQTIDAYVNDASPSSLVWSGLTRNATPGDHAIVLTGGDSLVFAVSGSPALGAQITVTATIKEVPALMAWSL